MIDSLFDFSLAVLRETPLVALALAGAFVVAAKVLSEWGIDSVRDARRRREHFDQKLQPVLDSASDLLSRIRDIFISRHDKRRAEVIARRGVSLQSRLPALTSSTLDRIEMAAYRLIHFLGMIEDFRRDMAETASNEPLSRARYFLLNKIPTVLRGNMYKSRLLSSEDQEELAVSFLSCGNGKAACNISVGEFCLALKSGQFSSSLFESVLDLFLVDTGALTDGTGIQPESDDWKRMMVLAQVSVYLADLVQDFEGHSQWEEVRLFSVRMIRQWNQAGLSYRYLYETEDLRSRSYIASYPTFSEPLGIAKNILYRFPLLRLLEGRASRLARAAQLWVRGGRYRRRHQPKRVHRRGVRSRRGDQWYSFNIDTSLHELHNELLRFMRASW